VHARPARIHGWACECGEPLEFQGDETTWGQRYRKEAGGIILTSEVLETEEKM